MTKINLFAILFRTRWQGVRWQYCLSVILLFVMQFSFAQLAPIAGTCTMTTTSTYGPMYATSNGSATNRTLVIYPANQLTGVLGQAISSIYFKKGSTANLTGTPNFKLYLKQTTNVDFGTAAADWATEIAGATLVYDSNPSTAIAGAAGWKSIPFSSNFNYTGNNLMLLMEYVNTGNTAAVTWSYEYTSPCVNTSNSNTTKYVNTTNGTLGAVTTLSDYRRPQIGFDYVVTCQEPSNVAITGATTSGASISWTAGGSEPSWDYSILPTGTGISTTFSNSTSTTINPNTLNSGTVYDFYVRASCGGTNGNSVWKGPYTFTTLCSPITTMFENFDNSASGNVVPICWARIVPASTAGTQSISTTTPASAPNNIYQYASSSQNPIVVVLPVFSNINAGTYWLRFKARISSGAGGALSVGYVTDPTDATTFVNIQTLTINNIIFDPATSEYTVSIPNTVPANARLAIKNAADGKSYYWDDVYWELKPTCFPPSNVVVGTTTANSAPVSWTAPSPVPASGYQLYYSTSITAPTSSTVLNSSNSSTSMTTSTVVSGLAPATNYYVWIRSNCGNGDYSSWTLLIVGFSTQCQPPSLLSANGATVCPGGTAALSATADSGADINWYTAATGGASIATGATYTTPPLSATTNYWVSASKGTNGYVGKDVPVSTSGNNGASDVGLVFDAIQNFKIKTIDVYPMHATNTTGTITVALKNSTGTVINSKVVNVNVSAAGVLNTVTLDFDVPAGTDYRLVWNGTSGVTNLIRESVTSVFSFPYTLANVCSIKSAYTGGASTSYYYYFYNWKVDASCESPRQMVTATVDATGCLGTSEVNLKENFKIHPNPFVDFINIQNVDKVKSISVVDGTGRIVKSNLKISESINLSDLKSGMYLLNLELKDGSKVSHKIMKK